MAIHKLTDKQVKAAKAGKLMDGAGLFLLTEEGGRKYWKWRKFQDGKTYEFGIGAYPSISLAEARSRAAALRIDFENGKRPGDVAAKNEIMTFDSCAEQLIKRKSHGWKEKNISQWISSLKMYASPAIGNKDISKITTIDIVKILDPIWAEKTETANRVRSRIAAVIEYATAFKYRSGANPAVFKGNLSHIFAPASVVRKPVDHHPSMPHKELPSFMRELMSKESISSYALQILIHSAVRTSEVTGTTWDEFDFETKTWVIPGFRMKEEIEHRVPMSDQFIEIINKIPRLAGNPHVFHSASTGKSLSNGAMLQLLRGMGHGVGGDKTYCVPHGFRSSFRVWGTEKSGHQYDELEKALAHAEDSRVVAAYNRTDLLENRRPLMQKWSDYITSAKTPE
jgi:integrase